MVTVTVSYILSPPAGTSASGLSPSARHEFPVSASIGRDADAQAAYYASLRTTIDEAKAKLGHEMTVWRDAVGKKEIEKEKAKQLKQLDEEEEEEEDEA
jgi:hypothetical protein